VGTIGEIAENQRIGVAPDEITADTAYIGLEHMPRRSIALAEWGMSAEVVSGKFRFEKGDILFGKLRPYFHKVGITPMDGVCSTDILVIRAKKHEWHSFVLAHVSSDAFVRHADGSSTGTKMPRTNWRDMARYPITMPPETLAAEYNRQVQPMLETIVTNIHGSRTLSALRDLLLPKLLSGEIRVKGN
jgi:type I restriction enzyme S subunit